MEHELKLKINTQNLA